MSTFKQLGLCQELVKAVNDLGFKEATEIQEKAIPKLIDSYEDFIGLAQTGTGKTAAFALPLLERVDPFADYTQALILSPTRELGKQIAEQLEKFSKYLPKVNTLVVYGGAAISNQIKALKKEPQHIIIATPGRLIDLIKRKAVSLHRLHFIVLDEADEMLNMGFKDELDKILSFTPEDKLTWLFSATMPNEIKRIVHEYMFKPFEVRINPKNEVNQNISHEYVIVKDSNKTEALSRFLDTLPELRGIVFCRTRKDTQNLAEELLRNNYKADAIHGDLPQAQRERVMKRFKNHELQVLIATDVAARGIDVNDLTHVFHHSLPDSFEYYTHRSGRTARAGKSGTSIAFVGTKEQYKINKIEKQLNIKFSKVRIPDANEVVHIRIENWAENIKKTPHNQDINQKILDKTLDLFQDVSKEELIEKLLVAELLKVKSNANSYDINASYSDNDRRGGGRKRNRNHNRNDRNEKNSSGKKYGHKKPNKSRTFKRKKR